MSYSAFSQKNYQTHCDILILMGRATCRKLPCMALRKFIFSFSYCFFKLFDFSRKQPSQIWHFGFKGKNNVWKTHLHKRLRQNFYESWNKNKKLWILQKSQNFSRKLPSQIREILNSIGRTVCGKLLYLSSFAQIFLTKHFSASEKQTIRFLRFFAMFWLVLKTNIPNLRFWFTEKKVE